MIKNLFVLVGPQGSGKTTYAKTFTDYVRISQDEQGQKGHLILFEDALEKGKSIIVDRINHIREQRQRYISRAKEFGYQTFIVEFFEDYSTCLKRMNEREDHPTIDNNDLETQRNALNMYFRQYESIEKWEADHIVKEKTNPYVRDITDLFNQSGKAIVIGDLHGCFDELIELLDKCEYNKYKDIIILAGDLVDRGNKIKECLEFLINNKNVFSVRGNHDDKFLRYLNKNKVHTKSLVDSIEQVGDSISYDKLFNKLHNTIIKFGNNYITHAGFNPLKHPEYTTREFSLYARKYDENLKTFTRDDSCPYWYEVERSYPMYNLFFGHEIHIDKCRVKSNIYAMDAGCVFGDKLRAAIVTPTKGVEKIIEIESKRPRIEKDSEWDHMNKFEPYDKLVEMGYLNKQENGDLVLYNYSKSTQYEDKWNKYTIESRGLILDKKTGDTVARPFQKFWNFSELFDEKNIKKS